jgi:hypothetical protein
MDVTATEFENRLGQYLNAAKTKPVIIKKSGCIKSVLIFTTLVYLCYPLSELCHLSSIFCAPVPVIFLAVFM